MIVSCPDLSVLDLGQPPADLAEQGRSEHAANEQRWASSTDLIHLISTASSAVELRPYMAYLGVRAASACIKNNRSFGQLPLCLLFSLCLQPTAQTSHRFELWIFTYIPGTCARLCRVTRLGTRRHACFQLHSFPFENSVPKALFSCRLVQTGGAWGRNGAV